MDGPYVKREPPSFIFAFLMLVLEHFWVKGLGFRVPLLPPDSGVVTKSMDLLQINAFSSGESGVGGLLDCSKL